ncbi:vWA domain-containing protein [Yoonia sp.]|uniref:vWA domain-containing protein n=1 Tax=Yoonia sp. TaxID=2212373 RepID=UPI003918BDA7
MRVLPACLLFTALSTSAVAQGQPNTILVLDGSGSMWGQIDGIAKITIAQQVIGDLLAGFPAEQGLGLTVYGHRTRGSCSDIETIVAPAPGTADQIIAAVNAIRPLGSTPMTDAVIAAAESLRYTEQAATVILVSDGIETCNPDPCAAARLLAETGIGFTTHVVGFDVSDPEALAQMQCLAGETGGQFLTAANAQELNLAMAAIVAEPARDPEPTLVAMTFTAVIGADRRVIDTAVVWEISGGDDVVPTFTGNPLALQLAEGAYAATAYHTAQEVSATAPFIAIGGGNTAVEIAFEDTAPSARIIAPAAAEAGSVVQVGWDGPDEGGDNIQIALPGESFYAYRYTASGNPVELQLPADPGSYELRYVLNDRDTIATTMIEVTPVLVGLTALAKAAAGSVIDVGWAGPNAAGDNIQIARPGGNYISYRYTASGNPVQLQIPAEPGAYELRYAFRDSQVIYTQPITVTEVAVALDAPASAPAGSVVSIGWTGPDADGDNVQVAEIGGRYLTYSYLRGGNPVDLQMPGIAGDYELRYSFRDSEVIHSQPITVTDVSARVIAPASVVAGAEVPVGWDGPAYAGDYLTISALGDSGYVTYRYIGAENPVILTAPSEPGAYEVRYILGQNVVTLATAPLRVTAP